MNKNNVNTLKLGIFVASGILIFILGIYYLGKMQNLFQSNIKILTDFKDVKGLHIGNNVRFMGINVGTVTGITILNDSLVRVEMGIDKNISRFVRKDSRVEINNEGLMGGKILIIHAGTVNSDIIEDEDQLHSFNSISIEDILKEVEKTTTLIGNTAENLFEISNKVNSGDNDLSKLINDNNVSQKVDKLNNDLSGVAKKAREILEKANNGNNDIAILLNKNIITDKMIKTLDNADSISKNLLVASNELVATTKSINHGNGAIQKLLYDSIFSTEIDTAVKSVNYGIDAVVETTKSIKNSWIINLFSGKRNK